MQVATHRVVAGPAGHWYALHAGELSARPMEAGESGPPPHPGDFLGPGTDGWYSPEDLVGDERAAVEHALTARVRVTFKHEDEVGGEPVGPVNVFDVDAYEADPEVAKGGIGVPFGYTPQGVEDLGWKSLADARRVAAERGVALEES